MIAYITHPDCHKHDMGRGHPESPARLGAIEDQLNASGLMYLLQHIDAPKATREQLARAHSAEYVDWVYAQSPETGLARLDGDTAMNPYSLDAALRAAGAAVHAVDLVMAGQVDAAFASVRPPGHHAGRGNSAGFCIFNNIAVAAAHALAAHGIERVAIADFDVHHGDGTENIFSAEPRVLYCSTFRHPYYPYSGADSGNEHIINVPLAAKTSGEVFRAAVAQHWLPVLNAFQPELLLVSAGFDAHWEDDMGGLLLNEADYAWVTGALKQIAQEHAQGRIVSLLEGGYALSALGRSAVAHIRSLGEL